MCIDICVRDAPKCIISAPPSNTPRRLMEVILISMEDALSGLIIKARVHWYLSGRRIIFDAAPSERLVFPLIKPARNSARGKSAR